MAASQSQVVTQINRIKVLKFTTLFAVGGTERQMMNVVRQLDRSRFELHMACLKRWGEFLGEVQALKIPLTEYRINSLYGVQTLKQQLRVAGYIRRNRIQIVHSYNFYPNVFAIPAARLAGAPVVIASIRDTGAYLTPMQKRVQKVACRFADVIVVNAEAVRQWLIAEGYDPANITVIRNGVDLDRFARGVGGAKLRRELGVPERAPLVAMLARVNRLKGVDDFLEAAAIVAARVEEARFLVVGGGAMLRDGVVVTDDEYQRELEGRAARLGLGGRVVFTGLRLDVPELLSEISVSVLPSLSEGLPNAVLESMAAGVPVVATRVGGNPEAVEHGVSGLLVPPGEPAALARAIGELLEKPELAARFGQAGRERVAKYFSLGRMVQETERLYAALLQKAGGGEPAARLRNYETGGAGSVA